MLLEKSWAELQHIAEDRKRWRMGMVDGLYSTWGSKASIAYLEGQLILKNLDK